MLVTYGFKNLLYHFKEQFQLNHSKNVMWCNYQRIQPHVNHLQKCLSIYFSGYFFYKISNC